MKLTVEVTAEDIAAGEPRMCSTCPIALAALRAVQSLAMDELRRLLWMPSEFPLSVERMRVDVEATDLEVVYSDGVDYYASPNYELPPEAQSFIVCFDDGEDVGTLKFELDLH